MTGTKYKIRVQLNNIEPAIWREIIIDKETLLPDLHKIIQTTMGWMNTHLHHFLAKGKIYAKPSVDDNSQVIDYSHIPASLLLIEEGDTLNYEYDFGDSWLHTIELDEILDLTPKVPFCITGERACPPEDCGGPVEYPSFLKAIKNTKSKDYKEMMEWMETPFDPEEFDAMEVNELFQEEDFGCPEMLDEDF